MTEWKIVPVEPTEEMLVAGMNVVDRFDHVSTYASLAHVYHAMTAAAPAAREAPSDAWQPIETAPKDGTRVLVWHREHGTAVASFATRDSTLNNPLVIALAGETGYWQLAGSAFGIKPTHWRPLPAPPLHPAGQTGGK